VEASGGNPSRRGRSRGSARLMARDDSSTKAIRAPASIHPFRRRRSIAAPASDTASQASLWSVARESATRDWSTVRGWGSVRTHRELLTSADASRSRIVSTLESAQSVSSWVRIDNEVHRRPDADRWADSRAPGCCDDRSGQDGAGVRLVLAEFWSGSPEPEPALPVARARSRRRVARNARDWYSAALCPPGAADPGMLCGGAGRARMCLLVWPIGFQQVELPRWSLDLRRRVLGARSHVSPPRHGDWT
jgi:hypothetical protein